MSRRDTNPFRKTRLALGVAALCSSLGACSTVPRDDGLGESLAEAGRATAEAGRATAKAGSKLWDRALYLLGYGEEDAGPADPRVAAAEARVVAAEPPLLDEVDLAMMEEDAILPSPAATEVVRSDAWSDVAAVGDAAAVGDGPLGIGTMPVAGEGLTHEVGSSETLWDIAKRTTGDATNWHVLADVNDLAPNAAVYPGQTIVVPPDLVRPELAGFATTAEADAAAVGGAPDAGTDPDAPALAAAGPEAGAETEGAGAPTAAERLAADVGARVDAATGGTELRLGAGETLWDFSRRTTGDATNWRAIAEANGFTDERATKVYENMRITVPTALLRDELAVASAADAAPTDGPTDGTGADAAAAVAAADPETLAEPATSPLDEVADAAAGTAPDGAGEALAAVAEDAASPEAPAADDDEPTIRIVEAAYRGDTDGLVEDAAADAAARADAAAIAAEEAAETVAANGAPTEIMVSGTYYPKAVYNDADFSSSLLMRVSPGTTLRVSRAIGPWYEVSTEQGPGYVHARDIK